MLTDKELKLAKKRYHNQKNSCKNRVDRLGNQIEFQLTFEEWLNMWISSGHYHECGRLTGQYVMSRKDDVGHYAVDNIEIKSGKDNQIEKTSFAEYKQKMKDISSSAEYKQKMKDVWQNPDHRDKLTEIRNSPEHKEKFKLGREKMKNDLEWQNNVTFANQESFSKPISCDGVIYPSQRLAAEALTPANIKHKRAWFSRHLMDKHPERYYYVSKE